MIEIGTNTRVIKILILAANPKMTPQLRLDEEMREIHEGLRRSKYRDQFDIKSSLAVRLRDLRRALLDYEPHIVHFTGHGNKDGLLVEDELGMAVQISSKALSGLFALFSDRIECVILSACLSEPQANAISKYINYVIGMQGEIKNNASIEFTVGFYDALGAGKSIEEAFEFGRTAILQIFQDLPKNMFPVLKKKKELIKPNIESVTLVKKRTAQLLPNYNSNQNNLKSSSKSASIVEDNISENIFPINYDADGVVKNSDEIWSILKRNVDSVPKKILKCELKKENKKYQLFEILIPELFSYIMPNYKWFVTPVQGDDGIDFYGKQDVFEIPEYSIKVEYHAYGQCKIKKGVSIIIPDVGVEIIKMRRGKHLPNLIILAIASKIAKNVLIDEKKALEEEFRCSFLILGIKEIEFLLRKYFKYIELILKYVLKKNEFNYLYNYFNQQFVPSKIGMPINISVLDVPDKIETGKRFDVIIKIDSQIFIDEEMQISWIWPEFPIVQNPQKSHIKLILPTEMEHPGSLSLKLKDFSEISINLKFIGFFAGPQRLGKLQFKLDKTILKEEEIGQIEFVDQYYPLFYREPYEKQLGYFNDLLSQSSAGHMHVIAVTGAGGSGKTRLCEEFGFMAERNKFRWISISHIKNLEYPYKIIGDFLRSLIPESSSIESPLKVTKSYLYKINNELAHKADGTLNSIFLNTEIESSSNKIFNNEVLIETLLTLLLCQSFHSPLCIHFCDMHWCMKEIFNIFSDLIYRLKTITNTKLTKIIFIFEGRISELNTSTYTKEEIKNTIIGWENFIDHKKDIGFKIEPLSEEYSNGFLNHLFENIQSPERMVPKDLIVFQDQLINNILRFSRGNPFHMIEQINLLRYKNIISKNIRTGLLFLSKRLEEEYEVPEKVEDLIKNRFNYFKEKYPILSRFIKAISLIKDRIEISLFNHLKEKIITNNISFELIFKTEFIALQYDKATDIGFRHENYFQVINNLPLENPDEIVKYYLEWFEKEKSKDADSLFDKACVMEKCKKPDYDEIRELYFESHKLFDKNHKHLMSKRVLGKILSTYPSDDSMILNNQENLIADYIKFKYEYAKKITWVGDWEHSNRHFLNLIDITDQIFRQVYFFKNTENREILKYRNLCSHIELSNGEINLLQNNNAIERLNKYLPEIVSLTNLSIEEKSKSICDWNELKIRALNRLGVAYWLNGDLINGRIELEKALTEARKYDNDVLISTQLRDLASINMHYDLDVSKTQYDDAITYLNKKIDDKLFVPRKLYIINYHQTVCLLLLEKRNTKKEWEKLEKQILSFISNLEIINYKCQKEDYVYEECGSALAIGGFYAVIGKLEAKSWLKKLIEIAQNYNVLNYLWRAHLNLAQFCLDNKISEEGAGHHAQHAQQILDNDLTRRKGIDFEKRVNFYKLPLLQLIRIWRNLKDNRADLITNSFPHLKDYFEKNDPYKLVEFRQAPEQIISLQNGQSNYFLTS